MKTSTKLLLSALVILIVSLGIYNRALKAEYLTGNYKKPYHKYNRVAMKDFNEIEINGAKQIDVELQQGDFAVYNNKNNEDSICFTKVGNKLVVNLNLLKDTKYNRFNERDDDHSQENRNRIIIICPRLSTLKTTNTFTVNGEKLTEYNYDKYSLNSHHVITLNLFKLDSLTIIHSGNSLIDLFQSNIGVLKLKADNYANIHFESNNKIGNADLEINKNAELELNDISFPKLKYVFSDSAKVSLNGASLKSFIKP